VARRSIEWGAASSGPLPVESRNYPDPLQEIRSTFVTLEIDGELRGCIGSLEASLPLVTDVVRSAYKAAYEDPRFPPVSAEERGRLEIHISVLEPSTPMSFASEEDLLSQLRPGVDGLILRDGRAQATFLPDVWGSLPEPRDFLLQLKKKAGLGPDHWAPTLEVSRYTTRSIG
jgi:AmmeMemoRadiSam system protein A